MINYILFFIDIICKMHEIKYLDCLFIYIDCFIMDSFIILFTIKEILNFLNKNFKVFFLFFIY